MLKIRETDSFKSSKSRLDKSYLIKLEKLIGKIIQNPQIGKPMRHNRKGTREVYLSPFRVSYAYYPEEDILTFLDIYHKNKQ